MLTRNPVFTILMPAALGLVAATFLGVGLYELIRRRPFMIATRWMLAMVAIVFIPSIAVDLELMRSPFRRSLGWSGLIVPIVGMLMPVVVVAYIAIASRGYIVFGTTQDSFRAALLGALSDLGLPFDERLSAVALPSVPAELHVAVQGWIGAGQLRLKGRRSTGDLMPRLARAMRIRLGEPGIPTNMTSGIFNLAAGCLMTIMAVWMMVH